MLTCRQQICNESLPSNIVIFLYILDEADHELDCVGHWDEDNNSYFITYEPEDPVSQFRCWVKFSIIIPPYTLR